MKGRTTTINEFAITVHKIMKTDRDCNIGCAGFTGEGKSTFLSLLFFEYSRIAGVRWDFDLMTWSRKELLEWIDGEKGKKTGPNGLKPKQLPEYSGIDVDELWLLFYKRNWYDEGQIDALATLNMCRDRHLLIGGNVPNFWDLDSAFSSRIRFFVYIVRRGVAWIFEQENNPFSNDPWNRNRNKMLFRKIKNPYMLPNFVAEIHFPDLTESQKRRYVEIRNKKRLLAIDQAKNEKQGRYKDLKAQRDAAIRILFDQNGMMTKNKAAAKLAGIKKLSYKAAAESLGLSQEAVRLIRHGIK